MENRGQENCPYFFFFKGTLDQYFSKSNVIVNHQEMLFQCRFKFHRSGVKPEFLASFHTMTMTVMMTMKMMAHEYGLSAKELKISEGLSLIMAIPWPSAPPERLKGECVQPSPTCAHPL